MHWCNACFFNFAEMLKMAKLTCLKNLVRLPQWEQVSENYYILTYNVVHITTGVNTASQTTSPMQ